MRITKNWLKSGRESKIEIDVEPIVVAQPSGQIGDAKWDEYVQLAFKTKERKFMRVTMTKEEAILFHRQLTEQLNKL